MNLLEQALTEAVARLERSLDATAAQRRRGLLPHVTEGGRWKLLSPFSCDTTALTSLPWTGGFVAGQLWLASRVAGSKELADEAREVTLLLAPRATQPNTHDLGFLFWPSALLGWLATADDDFRVLARQAAVSLAARLLPAGVIQVIGDLDDESARGSTITDTLPNLLLLWWAERQGDAAAGAAARSHLAASLREYFRPDGSTYHSLRFAEDGTVVERGTINGYATDSTWARGQAWAIHGLVSAYRATGGAEVLATAERAIAMFLGRLPSDLVPPWDFDAPPGGPRDSSAAAIVAAALFDLGRGDAALPLLHALVERCQNQGDDDGLLLHCCYRFPTNEALDSATVWGDFFFLDALVKAVAPEAGLDPLARP